MGVTRITRHGMFLCFALVGCAGLLARVCCTLPILFLSSSLLFFPFCLFCFVFFCSVCLFVCFILLFILHLGTHSRSVVLGRISCLLFNWRVAPGLAEEGDGSPPSRILREDFAVAF